MGLWGIYARVYDSLPKYYGPYQRLLADVVEVVESNTCKGSRILDVGCGTGNYSIELGLRGYDVEGIDFSYAMLERARLKQKSVGLRNVEFRQWDIDRGLALYPDDTFDCVLSINALYALKEPEIAISEYFRVLKPGGRFVLAEPQYPIKVIPVAKEIYSDGGLSNIGKLAVTQLGVGICSFLIGKRLRDGSYHFWNREALISRLEESGFSIDTMVPAYATNSLLLTSVVKPRCYFEMNGYRFLNAGTQADLEKAWSLRYQVYCVELGYEPVNQSGYEREIYDECAAHFLAMDEDNRLVGTLRVVPENPEGFPMDSDYPLTEYAKTNGISGAVEVGRFVIHRDVVPEERSSVAFGLFKGLVDYCNKTGINDIFATTQLKVVEKFKLPGLEQIGEPFEYSRPLCGGLWVPVHCDLRQAYENYLRGPLAALSAR